MRPRAEAVLNLPVVFLFSCFRVERPKLPLDQTLNHTTWDDYYTDNVMDTEVNCLAVSSKQVKRFEGK